MIGTVYFIQAGNDGPVKIGFTSDVEKRRVQLQIGCPHPLKVIREVDGDLAVERAFHDRFRSRRIRGEWFQFDAAMLTSPAMKTVPSIPCHTGGMAKHPHPLTAYLKDQKLSQEEFADKVGVHRSTIIRVVKRRGSFRRDLIDRIVRETGGAVQPGDFFAESAA